MTNVRSGTKQIIGRIRDDRIDNPITCHHAKTTLHGLIQSIFRAVEGTKRSNRTKPGSNWWILESVSHLENAMTRALRVSTYTVFSLLCIAVSAYAFYFLYRSISPGDFFLTKLAGGGLSVPAHFFGSGLALLLVPLQLSKRLRRNSITSHRAVGLLSAMAILIGGVSGLIMAFNATGGWVTGLGFGIMAVLWLFCTGNAVRLAMLGRIEEHRLWVYRSIALTAAAITFRIILGVGLGAMQLPFMSVYMPNAWLCWIINLIICEIMLYRRRPRLLPQTVS